MNDKISVIVPVYNVESYLDRCLSSLSKQIYRNIEVILVNDGSTDGSQKICEKYVSQFKNFTLINTSNKGQSAARNTGLKYASGKYIGFVDSDDFIARDFYYQLFNAITKTNADLACTPMQGKESSGSFNLISDEEAICRIMGGDLGTVVWNKLFNAKILDKVNFPVGQVHEEVEFNRQYLKKVRSVVVVHSQGYHYTHFREGDTNSRFELSRLNVFYQIKLFIADLHQSGKIKAENQLIVFGVRQFIAMYKVAYLNHVNKTVRRKIWHYFFYFFKKFFNIQNILSNPKLTLACLFFLIAPNNYIIYLQNR